ncbi:MAG: HEAT repeat domain-containing protein, partial [Acidobacteria bacterium]
MTTRGRATAAGRLLVAAVLLSLAVACAGRSPVRPAPSPPTVRPAAATASDDLELRALLLLLSDRRTFEALTVDRALVAGAGVRRELALALGRIGDPRGREALAVLLSDVEPAVRQAAAFALGRLGTAGDAATAALLLRAVGDADRETGRRAIEGLGRMGVALDSLRGALEALPEDEALARLLPSLFRFPEPAALPYAERGLALVEPQLRAAAAYGLAREPQPAAAPLLRPLLADPDPWIAGWAARALGRIGGRDDLPRLAPLLEGPEAGPIIQALRAARALIERGAAPPPEDWRPRLLALFDDPRPGVSLTAIEAASAWLLDRRLGDALAAIARDRGGRAGELAILALAEARDPRALPLVVDLARDGDGARRASAARAAGA